MLCTAWVIACCFIDIALLQQWYSALLSIAYSSLKQSTNGILSKGVPV